MTKSRGSWRPSLMTWSIALIGLLGLGALLYPATAQWISSFNQAQIVNSYRDTVEDSEPGADEQLAEARRFNDAMSSGAVLAADAPVPAGTGVATDPALDYNAMLNANDDGLMARLRYEAVGVDLAVYHGTSDETLLRGAGHLEGTSLPVGGASTHAVLTAHRGLANATMFSNLDQAEEGDVFTIETFGEVLAYRAIDVRVVEPDETDTLRAVEGKDLVTLVTCTPLGINSHRILVTAERIEDETVAAVAAAPESHLPGFPWWSVALIGGLLALDLFVLFSGYGDARARQVRAAAAAPAG